MGLIDVVLGSLLVSSSSLYPNNATYYSDHFIKTDRQRDDVSLRHDIRGKHFRVATLQNNPLSYAVYENSRWVGKGISFDILNILQSELEFEYSIVLPEDNILGSNRSGIFGQMYHHQADIGAAFFPMTAMYWEYAEFAVTIDVGKWVVLMKRPKQSANGSGLLEPFTLRVWLAILVALVVFGPLMHILMTVQKYVFVKYATRVLSLEDCYLYVYGSIMKQGMAYIPKADSTRFLYAAWWLFGMVITAFYTANLTAFLTLSVFTLPIKGPSDIGAKGYPWVTSSGNAIEAALQNNFEDVHALLRQSPRKFSSESGSEILDRWVNAQGYLYIVETPKSNLLLYEDYMERTRKNVEEIQRCAYVATQWTIFKSPRTFVYSKRFKYATLFNKKLQILVESGIVKRTLSVNLPTQNVCPLNLGGKERRLKNNDLSLTYTIVVCGYGIATLVFCLEYAVRILTGDYDRSKVESARSVDLSFDYGLPPPYDLVADLVHERQKKYVNGRHYYVEKSPKGNLRLIPMRTPSALLFHYRYLE